MLNYQTKSDFRVLNYDVGKIRKLLEIKHLRENLLNDFIVFENQVKNLITPVKH